MILLAAALSGGGCISDHHVSPWGTRAAPSLGDYILRPDLDRSLRQIDAEAKALGLAPVIELRGDLVRGSDRAVVIRGYEGHDAMGRAVHAVRAATARGVVLALGPLDTEDDRSAATELVPALVSTATDDGSAGAPAFQSGTDLTGTGGVDIVVKNEASVISVIRLGSLGSTSYAIAMATPPLRATVLPGESYPALLGEARVPREDPIKPRLTDVATFEAGRYSNATEAACAFHERALKALAPPTSPPTSEGPPASSAPAPVPSQALRDLASTPKAAPPGGPAREPVRRTPDDVRLRTAIERAWHRVLARSPRDAILRELRAEAVPPALRSSFDRHAGVVEGIPKL